MAFLVWRVTEQYRARRLGVRRGRRGRNPEPRGTVEEDMKTRLALPALTVLALVIAACSTGATPSPSPTGPAPTPTPIAADVSSPADAAALVIATNPLFEGAAELNPDMIGASKYWEAQALDDGAFQITMTIGWGDCQAGCIERHTWIYNVTADGQLTLVEESGDPLPAGSFPPG